MLEGITLEKVQDLDQDTRNLVACGKFDIILDRALRDSQPLSPKPPPTAVRRALRASRAHADRDVLIGASNPNAVPTSRGSTTHSGTSSLTHACMSHPFRYTILQLTLSELFKFRFVQVRAAALLFLGSVFDPRPGMTSRCHLPRGIPRGLHRHVAC